MRRHNYKNFMKNSVIGLLADCVYFSWQHSAISDEEEDSLYYLLKDLYEKERGNHG